MVDKLTPDAFYKKINVPLCLLLLTKEPISKVRITNEEYCRSSIFHQTSLSKIKETKKPIILLINFYAFGN